MKKRVIQINGLSGLLMTLFIVTCLIAGFVFFPAFVCMSGWNYLASRIDSVVSISFLGGLLLWGIIVVCFLISNKRHLIVSFGIPNTMTPDELREIFKKAEDSDNPDEILKEIEKKVEEENSKENL